MTTPSKALYWAMQDLEDVGIDPMLNFETTRALTQLYTSLTGETP